MRALALVVILASATVGTAQALRREGGYKPHGGKTVSWQIDGNHDLVWGGARYTPIGTRVDGTAAAVDAANDSGVKDLLIDLPIAGDWDAAIQAAERNGQRYLVRVSSLAPAASGIIVDPSGYRVAGVTGSKHLDIPMPGASEALVVVASQRDNKSILSTTLVPVREGRLAVDTKVNASLQNVILIYPRADRLDVPDLWQGLDSHRDGLLGRLRRSAFGPGLRGVVDPLGRSAALPGKDLHGVPTSTDFQAELASVMERKHRTVENAMDAWSLSASSLTTSPSTGVGGKAEIKTTFMDLARLVPLWSGGRGVPLVWDPSKDKTYNCDLGRSRAWEDIEEAIQAVASRRIARLCASIRRVVDVPVVQEWNGWAGLSESSDSPFDGIAARVAGETPSELVDSAARAVSTVTRWPLHGWLIATEVRVPEKAMPASIDDLAGLGIRAAFVDAPFKRIAAMATDRAASPPLGIPIDPLYFPENAANPAAVQRLPGGRWWLPTPEDGNRLDFGDSFYGYRITTPKGSRVVLWARTPGRYLLRMIRPADVTVMAMDGSDPDPRISKTGLTVTIGQVPVAIDGLSELPVPDISLKETLDVFVRLTEIATEGRHVGTDESYAFTQAASAFDTNPGGSYTTMRLQIRRFAAQLSPLTWVEAESPTDTTFSEVAPLPGASGDRALILRAALPSDDGFVANYTLKVSTRDDVDLWVAARLAPEQRRDLEASIGGVTLFATEPPVSAYGAGFGWYHLGRTKLTGGTANVSLRMRAAVGTESAIDAIVFAPPGWRPNGVAYPYGMVTGTLPHAGG